MPSALSFSARFQILIKPLFAFLLGLLPIGWRYRIFRLLSESFNVESIVVRGINGAIEGGLRDEGLFRKYAQTGTWSENILQIIRGEIQKKSSGTYIDIGANVGLTTIPLVGKNSWSFFAFEPDPENFLRLRLNLIRNLVDDRVVAHNIALSDKPGSLKLRRSPINSGDYRIVSLSEIESRSTNKDSEDWTTIDVASRPLDDVLPALSISGPLVIKIDTQGAEALIVKGGLHAFSKADLVILEFWPHGIARQGGDATEFLIDLEKMFFNVEVLDADTGQRLASSFDRLKVLNSKIIEQSLSTYFDLVLSGPKMGQS